VGGDFVRQYASRFWRRGSRVLQVPSAKCVDRGAHRPGDSQPGKREWIIPISRRVNDKNGQFQGVLMAGIKMSYFDQFFKSFSIDDNGSMFLG
jgi:hypothetical protein